MKAIPFNQKAVERDISLILASAELPENFLKLEVSNNDQSTAFFLCKKNTYTISIASPDEEKTSTIYKAIRELGFLFPHPRVQISPSLNKLKGSCGKSWHWKPVLKFRGYHLHTLHPSEWVAGFYQNHPAVAEQSVRWMARNQQNIFDLSLLDVPLKDITEKMRPHFELARSLQIHTGVSLGIALNQQNSYKLLSLWDSYFGWSSDEKIEKGIKDLANALPLSYVVLEAGTSEFTPTDFEKTLRWLNLSAKILKEHHLVHFTKVHVSSNQVSSKWGNYNFLPQYGSPDVGILPHTVMFYGVMEDKAPMYGNKNFFGIRDFMLKEKEKRPDWYYPETSYWVGMDMDIPLFLTDYLRTRTEDMQFLKKNGIEGQLNFTTGHALGYWLYDWNLALMNDEDYHFDYLKSVELIGESRAFWEKLTAYQKKWYKEQGLIALLTSSNLQDELSKTHRIHDRFTMKDLSENPEELEREIALLKASLEEFPRNEIRHPELRTMLEVTRLRHEHALMIREKKFSQAKEKRETAKKLIAGLAELPTNYPELLIFKEWKNPTAYQFGYVYPAASLYFWEREERQLETDSYFPLKGNMYDFWDIVF